MRVRQPLVEFLIGGQDPEKATALRMSQQFRPFAIRPYICSDAHINIICEELVPDLVSGPFKDRLTTERTTESLRKTSEIRSSAVWTLRLTCTPFLSQARCRCCPVRRSIPAPLTSQFDLRETHSKRYWRL